MTSINDIYYGQNTTNVIFKKTWSPSTGLYPTDMTEGIMYIAEDDGTVGVEEFKINDAIFYKDTEWVRLGSSVSGAPVTVSDTAPTTPEEGDLWWDSTGDNSGPLYTWNGVAWATSESGSSIENWTPVPIDVPVIGTIDISGNTTITPNATGATFEQTTEGGAVATSFSDDTIFEMSTVETGMYFKLINIYDNNNGGGGGYNGFTNSTADWYSIGGPLCGLFVTPEGDGTLTGDLQVSVGDYGMGTTEGNATPVIIPLANFVNKEMCISVYHDNVDTITVNLYSEDNVNVPMYTVSHTLTLNTLQEAVDSITRSFTTMYQDTATFSPNQIGTHFTIPSVPHSNVTLFSDVKVDPTSYPTVDANTLFRVDSLVSPLYAEDIDVTLKNGFLTSFSAAGALETASPELTANEINVQLAGAATLAGNNTFIGENTFEGIFKNKIALKSNNDDAYEFAAFNTYQYVFVNNGNTALTGTLEDISPSSGSLFPYLVIETSGHMDKTLTITASGGNNFTIDGVDTGSATYAITGHKVIKFIRGGTTAGSSRWQIIDLTGGGGDVETIGDADTFVTADPVTDTITLQPYAPASMNNGSFELSSDTMDNYANVNNLPINFLDSGSTTRGDIRTSSTKLLFRSLSSAELELSSPSDLTLAITDPASSEVKLNTQTADMNMTSPSDLAVATKKYVDDNGFSDTALQSYTAAAGISLTTANFADVVFTAGGSGASSAEFNYSYTDIKRNPFLATSPRLRFFDDGDSYAGTVRPLDTGGLQIEGSSSASYAKFVSTGIELQSINFDFVAASLANTKATFAVDSLDLKYNPNNGLPSQGGQVTLYDTSNVLAGGLQGSVQAGKLNLYCANGSTIDLDTTLTLATGTGGNVDIQADADIYLQTPATGEVSTTIQTSAMNSGSPTALAVATKGYIDNHAGLFDTNSLNGYIAAEVNIDSGAILMTSTGSGIAFVADLDIDLTTEVNFDINLNTSGTGRVKITEDPVSNEDVANKKYVDQGNLKAVTVTFDFNDATLAIGSALPANALVVSSRINVTTAFDDVASTATVGNSTTADGVSTTADSDLSTLGLYTNDSLFDTVADGQLNIIVSSGTSTQGAGRVLVEYYIP